MKKVKTKLTKDCFVGPKYGYRDSYLDSWLPDTQEVKEPVDFKMNLLDKPMTFQEMADAFGSGTFTLPEIETLIEQDYQGLEKTGWGNFFLVEGKEGVSVVLVRRRDGLWREHVRRLGSGFRWGVGRRFFSRNSDTRSLENSDTSVEKAIDIVKKAGYVIYKPV